MSTTDPIRDQKQLRKLTSYFFSRKQYRNYVLIVLGTCTALRISDLLTLRWEDVFDFETITKHYLGITQDDIDRVYRGNNFRFSSFISGSNRRKRHLSAETWAGFYAWFMLSLAGWQRSEIIYRNNFVFIGL